VQPNAVLTHCHAEAHNAQNWPPTRHDCFQSSLRTEFERLATQITWNSVRVDGMVWYLKRNFGKRY